MFFDQKRYDEAKVEFDKALSVNSEDAEAHNGLGRVALIERRYEDAEKAFRRASELNSKEPAYHSNLGLALQNLKKYDEAIRKYQQAVEIDHKYADAYFNWGCLLLDLKRYEEAIAVYRRATEADKSYSYAYHNTAYILDRQGKYKEAKKKWEEARDAYYQTKQDRKSFQGAQDFQYLGNVLHSNLGQLDDAERIYKEGLLLDPNHIGLLTGLVDLYLEQKDRFLEKKDDANGTIAYWKAREVYKRAEAILKDQIQKADEARIFIQLGQLHLKMQEYAEAETHLIKALAYDKESVEAYANLGIVYVRRDDFRKGAQYFEDALRRDPDDLTVRSNLGEAYLKAKILDKAEAEYKKILAITPNHVESEIGLGEVYTAMGDAGDGDIYDQAIEYFNRGINKAQSEVGSKTLKKKELAAVLYSRGYARVKLYEATRTRPDEKLLRDAMEDFGTCRDNDQDHHKAGRALEKLKKRLNRFAHERVAEKWGPWVISGLSMVIFLASQVGFYIAHNKKEYIGYYALFTFGSLIFMVAGFYLPQILKLKVAGIELEKSSVDQITLSGTLGISK